MILTRAVNLVSPINWQSPMTRGIVSWWLSLPGITGGGTMVDLCNRCPSALEGNATWGAVQGNNPISPTAMLLPTASGHSEARNLITGFPFSIVSITRQSTTTTFIYNTSIGSDSANRAHFSTESRSITATGWRPGLHADNNAAAETEEYQSTTSYQYGPHQLQIVTAVCRAADARDVYAGDKLDATRTASVTFHADIATGSTYQGEVNIRGAGGSTDFIGSFLGSIIYNRDLTASDVANIYQDAIRGFPRMLNRVNVYSLGSSTAAPATAAHIVGGGVGGGSSVIGA